MEPLRQVILLADRVASSDQIRSVRAFIERLGHHGFAARVVCSYWGEANRNGVSIDEVSSLADHWRIAWTIRGLRQEINTAFPCVLHVLQSKMAPAGLEMAERWRIPYVQGVEEFLAPDSRLRLSRHLCRAIVATSPELRDDLVRNCGVPVEAIRVVHRGIARTEFSDRRPPVSSPKRVVVVGAAGPLNHVSGFATYLNAARRVIDAGIDAEFILVGHGEEEAELRRRAERLRLSDRLTFAGEAAVGLSFWDVLDVYCQPSIVPTVGRNLARALARGLPSVASDIEGLRSLIIHNGTGLRVPPGDTNALARGILDLLADRAVAERLGQRGREVVLREYDLDREAASLAALYHDVLAAEVAAQGRATTLSLQAFRQATPQDR